MVLKESLRRQDLVEVSMEFGETKYLTLSLDEKEPRLLKTAANVAPSAWQRRWPVLASLVAQGSRPGAAGGPGWTSLCSSVPTVRAGQQAVCCRARSYLRHSEGWKAFSFWWHYPVLCVWLFSSEARMLPGKMWGTKLRWGTRGGDCF